MSLEARLRAAVIEADDAANGDSNDAEIDSLKFALALALAYIEAMVQVTIDRGEG